MSEQSPSIIVEDDGTFAHARFEQRDWHCLRCRGRGGFLDQDELGYDFYRHCCCRRDERRIRLFNQAGIGRRFRGATFDSFAPTSASQMIAKDKVLSWAGAFPAVEKGMILWGSVGSGKTHLAVALFRFLTLDKGIPCRFVDFGNLLADLRRSFEDRAGSGHLLLPLVEVEVLVIDELGKGRKTPWEETVLDDLISRRYNAGRVTLATTNFVPRERPRGAGINPDADNRQRQGMHSNMEREALEERVGVRIYSRLCEMCEFVFITSSDFRKKDDARRR